MKPKIKTVYFFENGQCACGDEQRQQIAELQVPIVQLWCERAVSLGYDPEGATLQMELGALKITKHAAGNWTTIPIE